MGHYELRELGREVWYGAVVEEAGGPGLVVQAQDFRIGQTCRHQWVGPVAYGLDDRDAKNSWCAVETMMSASRRRS